MTARLICVCGRTLSVPEGSSEQTFTCPHCETRLHVPNPEEDRKLIRWYCACGQRLKASARSRGRKVNCPQCGFTTTVPAPGDEGQETPVALPDEDTDKIAPTILTPEDKVEEKAEAGEGIPLAEDEEIVDLPPPSAEG